MIGAAPLCAAAASGWAFDPWIVIPLSGSATLYALGTASLWRRAGFGHGIRIWQAAAYAAGWLVLAAALCSPLHLVFEALFALHMVEHELVMAVAAPLIAIAAPLASFLWVLPKEARAAFGDAPGMRHLLGWLTRPWVATTIHGLAIWAWHVPRLYDAAVLDPSLHRLQHVSFFLTALLFWWSLARRSNPGMAAGHLFATMIHTTILGALIALAPRIVYPAQTAFAWFWGLSPLEDQQLAGIIMWVPAGTVYAGSALYFLARWIRLSRNTWSYAVVGP